MLVVMIIQRSVDHMGNESYRRGKGRPKVRALALRVLARRREGELTVLGLSTGNDGGRRGA